MFLLHYCDNERAVFASSLCVNLITLLFCDETLHLTEGLHARLICLCLNNIS